MFSPEALKKIVEQGAVQFRQSAISYIFTCPRCDKRDKLYIRKSDGRFVCFVCKETSRFKGAAEFALHELYSVSIGQLRQALYGDEIENVLGMDIPEFADIWGYEDDFSLEESEQEPIGVVWPPDVIGPESEAFAPAREYLRGRGIDDALIAEYGIRYLPSEKRVLFPYVVNGKLLGWQGRYIKPTEFWDNDAERIVRIPKALTKLPQGVSGRYVMFHDRLDGADHCVLTEGPIDAIKAHLCGGNVAALGKGVTRAQIATIAQKVKKLYLALDPDAADEIRRIAQSFMNDFEIYLIEPPAGREDLGDATPEEVLIQFKNATRIGFNQIIVSCGGELFGAMR